jgi:hypothetical protein
MEVRVVSCLRINRPAWFANAAFRHWLANCPGVATCHNRSRPVSQLSHVFLVYLDEDWADEPGFPQELWAELCALCRRQGFTSGVLWLSNWDDRDEVSFTAESPEDVAPP